MDKRMGAIIITGANGNIGAALAETLLKKGENTLLLFNKNHQRIDSIIERYPRQTIAMQCDIRNIDTLIPAISVSLSAKSWLPLSLVHTAALRSTDHNSLRESNPQVWREVIESNIIGTYNVLKAVINCFQETKIETTFRSPGKKDNFCRIVLLGSDVSRIGLPFGSAYGASKAAISNITRSLGVELSGEKILINTVSPGPVNIDDCHFSDEYREFREKYYNKILSQIPLKRFAEAEDIVGLTLFLISEENRYITGEEFFLTGGKI